MPVTAQSTIGIVKISSRILNVMQEFKDFLKKIASANSAEVTKTWATTPGVTLKELEAQHDKPSRNKDVARVSTRVYPLHSWSSGLNSEDISREPRVNFSSL